MDHVRYNNVQKRPRDRSKMKCLLSKRWQSQDAKKSDAVCVVGLESFIMSCCRMTNWF